MTVWCLVATLYLGVQLPSEPNREPVTIERYESAEAVPGGVQAARWKTDWVLLRRIDPTPGPVTIGQHTKEENTLRQIELTEPYYLAVYETTRAQWAKLNGTVVAPVPEDPMSAVKPVARVAYNQVVGVLAGTGFSLPTEAQWEYACRAGDAKAWDDGSACSAYAPVGWKESPFVQADHVLDRLGRYAMNGGMVPNGNLGREPRGAELATNGPAVVGSYLPNAWGLYDLQGNVYELCTDWYSPKLTAESAGRDPRGPAENPREDGLSFRVIKGGSWWNFRYGSPEFCRPGERSFSGLVATRTPHQAVGFRLLLPVAGL